MQRIIPSSLAILFFAACTSLRPHAAPATTPAAAAVAPQFDSGWWRDAKIARALALTANQQLQLDVIARHAQDDLGPMQHDADEAGSFIGVALNAEPFDPETFGEIAQTYTLRQAQVIARDLQRVAEIRSVLSHDQWTQLQRINADAAGVRLQSSSTDAASR